MNVISEETENGEVFEEDSEDDEKEWNVVDIEEVRQILLCC